MTVQDVDDRLEQVAASAVTWADVDQLLEPLREATLLLANGDTQGALRVLSGAEGE